MTLPLSPEHLQDLRRSGLSDETIRALRIHSARPGDIPRLLGFNPRGVTSAMVFAYPGCDGFVRLKLFPPAKGRDGHTIRYAQPKGSGVRAYIPPQTRAALTTPATPVLITEGEKKAAKASQEGFACIGLGGLWNFAEKDSRNLIADLEGIRWDGRPVFLVPDSDVWSREDLLHAVVRLGNRLTDRGATVRVIRLPTLAA